MPIKIIFELDADRGCECQCVGHNSTPEEREIGLTIREALQAIIAQNFRVERTLTFERGFKPTQTDPSTESDGTGTDATSN